MKRRRLVSAVLLPAIIVSFGAGSAAGNRPSLRLQAFTIEAAKSKSGNYRDYQRLNLDPGEKTVLFWKVTNGSPNDLSMTFDDASTEDPNPAGFKITWYRGARGTHEISSAVKGPGYDYTLRAGRTKYFRARVRATSGGHACLQGQTGSGSAGSGSAGFGINGDCN